MNGAADGIVSPRATMELDTASRQELGHCTITIMGVPGHRKSMDWRCVETPVNITTTNRWEGSGYFNNSTSTITSIQIINSGGGATSWPAGAVVRVWGSLD